MATSTLVQDLTAGRDIAVSARRQVETFIAGGTVAGKDFVALKLNESADGNKALKVVRADNNSSPVHQAIVGVVLTAGTHAAGDRIEVVVAGICEANVDSATDVGSPLCCGATAGQADVYEASFLHPIVAISAEADSTNVATVFMIKQF